MSAAPVHETSYIRGTLARDASYARIPISASRSRAAAAPEPAPATVLAPSPAPSAPRRPDISVVPGTGAGSASQTRSSLAMLLVWIAVAAFVVLMALGFVRITLNVFSVSAAKEAQTYSSQIDQARSETSELEVALASSSNPTRIKTEAATLGMGSAEQTAIIDLGDDVGVTDEAGTLSLSGSIAALTAGQSQS